MLAADAGHLAVPCATAIRTMTGSAGLEKHCAAIEIGCTTLDLGQLLLCAGKSVDDGRCHESHEARRERRQGTLGKCWFRPRCLQLIRNPCLLAHSFLRPRARAARRRQGRASPTGGPP